MEIKWNCLYLNAHNDFFTGIKHSSKISSYQFVIGSWGIRIISGVFTL